jgi:periplasmic divalent cation tolerance protein
MDKLKIIYITCPNIEEAKNIAKELLEKKLIACANMLPIESLYVWEDKLTEDKEIVLLLKTKQEKANIVEEEIKKIHSYDIPCILKLDAEANPEYNKWVEEQIK